MVVADVAARIAADAHAGQVDKAGLPYIEHPRAVAALLAGSPGFAGLDPHGRDHALAAAYLHDVLEDTEVTDVDLLAAGIPIPVVASVRLLTHRGHEPRSVYYARIVLDPIARLVKVADVAHNASRERLAVLDEATAARLAAKYADAAEALLAGADERSWFSRATA